MREGLRGLTGRGRCFLYGAAAAAVAALILGEKDFLRIAVLVAALPLLAAWHVGRSRYRLSCHRSLDPSRVQAGMTARVLLRLENLSNFTTGTLLLEDRLPYSLGSRPRIVLERLGRRHASTVAYTVRADVRGRFEVGPLVVRLTDPFGLCELTRSFPSVDHLVVIPQVHPLPMVRLAGEYAGAGESHARTVAVHGEDDAATREYRHGDDLRRVHWRSTARTGELMVRREEQPWESRATIVLDTRARAHRGEGPTSSFEWAVSAAASVAEHLRHAGYKARLVTDAGIDVDTMGPDGSLLDHLAEVQPSQHGDLGSAVDQVRLRSDGGLIIAILGLLDEPEAEMLASLRRSGTTCVAFFINSTTWLNLSTEAREAADEVHSVAGLSLLRTGWRVIDVSHGASLAALWPQVGRGAQSFAWRATLAETVSGGVR
ncbi:MAG TPA: DUF58 domain-containing protein [Micromonosporaceae bacterium]